MFGGALALLIGAAGYGIHELASGDSDDGATTAAEGGGGSVRAKPIATGPPTAAESRRAARDFLAAWAAGDTARAAGLTDDPKAARTALADYHDAAHIDTVTLTPGTPDGARVPFRARAHIKTGAGQADFGYRSRLTVVRDPNGRAVVDWRPSVLHPKLRHGDTLRTGAAQPPPIKAVDRHGVELTAGAHPSLTGVLADLRDRYGAKAGGSAPVELRIVRGGQQGKDGGGKKGGDSKPATRTLKVLSKGTPGTLRTTLDAAVQTAAERAVAKHPKASVVALKASTGEILAVANAPATGFNGALRGSLAPGSTMKVVTAATLIDKGMTTGASSHPCPRYASYGGWKFHNLDTFEIKGGTFAQSFARSCNTAFITQAKKLSDDALTKEARDVFGIGLNWRIGVPTFDGGVPVQKDAPKAASLIGQGGVRMNPLTMASVSATASTGEFHQPYLVAAELDRRTLAKAPRGMKASTTRELRGLMRLTATSGTAAEAMAGVSGDIGAKTGSAEVDNQKEPNGWFTAYRDDLAAAAVVPKGGHGGDSAGPVVRAVLLAG